MQSTTLTTLTTLTTMLTRLCVATVAVVTLAPLAGCDDQDMHTGDEFEGAEAGIEQPEQEDEEPAAPPVQAIPCAEVEPVECRLGPDTTGTSYCLEVDGEQVWTPCGDEFSSCTPGENYDMGCTA